MSRIRVGLIVATSCIAVSLASAQTTGKKTSAVPKLPAAAAPAATKADVTDTPVTVGNGGELLYAAAPSPFVAVGHNPSGKGE